MEHPQPLGQRRKVLVEHDEQGTGILRNTEMLVLFIRSSDRALDLISWLCEPRDGRLVETPMGTAWKHFTRQPACSNKGCDMRRFNDLVQWHKASGRSVVVHDLTLIPQSQVLIVRFPWGAYTWHRPTAMLVERNGRVELLPIVDLTRLIQLGFVGLCVVIIIVSFVQFARRKEHVS